MSTIDDHTTAVRQVRLQVTQDPFRFYVIFTAVAEAEPCELSSAERQAVNAAVAAVSSATSINSDKQMRLGPPQWEKQNVAAFTARSAGYRQALVHLIRRELRSAGIGLAD